MKQYIGIRCSKYGQVRIGIVEREETLCFGQAVVAYNDNSIFFGRIVWQCSSLSSPEFLLSKMNEKNQEENGEVRAKSELSESIDFCKPQNPFTIRLAQEDEIVKATEHEELVEQAFEFCRNCIKNHGLEMKLVDVEVLLDRSKMIFYFTAPTRIDFRELVKDLVREYRTRIELRQIGVRHETQMLGALGNCGMVICCRRYLKNFAPVTIKMAKEQNLFLNPAKISGICGRLLCCLSYEQDTYDAFHNAAPKIGKRYTTDMGILKVVRTNMFKNTVAVLNEQGQEQEIDVDGWEGLHPVKTQGFDDCHEHDEQTAYGNYMSMGNDEHFGEDMDFSKLLDDEYQEERSQNRYNRKPKPHYRQKEKQFKRASFDESHEEVQIFLIFMSHRRFIMFTPVPTWAMPIRRLSPIP